MANFFSNLFRRKGKKDLSGNVFKVKYQNFRELLDSNTEISKVLSDIEESLEGHKIFGMSYVRSVAAKAIFHTLRMIDRINVLSGNRYELLYPAHGAISEKIRQVIESHHHEASTGWILSYDNITRELVDKVGGKSANLGEVLNKVKLPVPRGFAITVDAFHYFMDQKDLKQEINKILTEADLKDPQAIEKCSEMIQEKILLSSVPEELVEEIIRAYKNLTEATGKKINAALRSSAIGEDGDVSFAGQYLSLLNVPEEKVITSYKYIVASLYTPRAIAYRFRMGIPDEDCAMSVACIEMIEPLASGVCYSRDPNNPHLNEVTINAIWGLGAYLVDGKASGDTYRVKKDTERTIVHKDIQQKEIMLISNPEGGLTEVIVREDMATKPCLRDDQIKLLAEYSIRLENHYGFPQDTEWAVDSSGTIFILQTRPLKLSDLLWSPDYISVDIPDSCLLLITDGVVASPGIAQGTAVLKSPDEDLSDFPQGGILVAKHSSPKFVIIMDRVGAIVADAGNITGHMASVAREFKVPTILNTKMATKVITPGDEIIVDAYNGRVYKGKLSDDFKDLISRQRSSRKPFMVNTPVYKMLQKIAQYIVPLNLVDPQAPNFSPAGCKTMHDIMRFVHEKSYTEMFKLSDCFSDQEENACKLKASIPLNLYVIDLGGGINPQYRTKSNITPEHIDSIPFRALLRGMLNESFTKPAPRPVEFRGFFSVLGEQMLANPYTMERFGDRSYAVISDKYLHFSSRVGYHFAILDSYCGYTTSKNYINFAFKGGAADDIRRNRRARAIAGILKALNFSVEVVSDRVEGRMQKYDMTVTEETLDQIGRLLQFTRQMDMLIYSEPMIQIIVESFLKGNYNLEDITSQTIPPQK